MSSQIASPGAARASTAITVAAIVAVLAGLAFVPPAAAGTGNGAGAGRGTGAAGTGRGAAVPGAVVRSLEAAPVHLADGQVEAVRQTVIAPQVAGRVTALTVKAGDAVRAGQLLLRIDASAAVQSHAASAAQLAAARAQLTAAERNLERTRQLVERKFLSASTLDRAEADQRAAAETVKAMQAQTAGAAVQAGWHTIVAPFDAIVASVSTELGDTAMPGKPLMLLYDPRALRVAVNVPASVAARLDTAARAGVEIPDAPAQARRPPVLRTTLVAATDPVSHTQLVRLDLPGGLAGLTPGLFARVQLTLAAPREAAAAGVPARVAVPAAAVVSRGDLRGVYVADAQGAWLLRQVRLGRSHGDEIEVLSGLAAGETVALDPVAAARVAGLVAGSGKPK